MQRNISNIITEWWQLITGAKNEFTLQARLLNGGGFFSAFVLGTFVLYNLLIDLKLLALITATTLLVQIVLYYLSRVKKQFWFARIGYIIGSYIFLSLNYWYSSGIDGPALFGFFLTFAFIIAIMPKEQHPLWLLVHLLVGSILLMIQYYYPSAIKPIYASRADRYSEIAITYILILSFIYVVVAYVVSNYNVERRNADEYLASLELKTKQLEDAYNENNRLISIISHDLRSPLGSIQGYLELVKSEHLSQQERQIVEDQLLGLTKGTSDLLHNLVSWSKAQAKGHRMQLVTVEVKAALTTTLQIIRHIATEKNVQFTNIISGGTWVVADVEMLQLAVRNLLYNAVKFTPENGTVILTAEQDGAYCKIIVEDTGVGIPESKQADVFTTKIKSSKGTHSETGIGLGLLLCKDFIEAMKGKIWFESKPGKGSKFFIQLPSGQVC